MIRGRPFVLAAIVAAATPSVRAQGPSAPMTVTLDEAIQQAIAHNLNLLAERDNVRLADAAILTAGLRPNPVVTFTAARPDQALVDAGVSPNEQIFRTDYVLERGGKRDRRIEEASLAKSSAALQLANSSRLLVLDVARAFTDVQLAKLNLALAADTLKAFNDVVAVNTQRVRAGDLSEVELVRSRLAALQYQNDLRGQELKLRSARNRLSMLIGRGPAGDTLDTTGELRTASLAIGRDALLRQALDARPDLRALRTEQARSVAELKLQLANGKVDYTVGAEYHRQESTAIHGNAYAFVISAPLPLFSRNQGEIARARVQQSQLDAKVRALEAAVASDVASAYDEYATARELLNTIDTQMLAQAREVRATTEYSYRRGEASFIEFLDAQRAFNDTMRSYHEARVQYAQSLYAIDALITRREQP
jgi:cobalt-zinc-cadmium efflux system outer membrane protein